MAHTITIHERTGITAQQLSAAIDAKMPALAHYIITIDDERDLDISWYPINDDADRALMAIWDEIETYG